MELHPNCQQDTVTGLCDPKWQGRVQNSPELSMDAPQHAGWMGSVWLPGAPPSAALAHPCRHFCTAAEISAGREGGRRGSRATSLSKTISLCQLLLFMEFQLSRDNSTVCQIDRPPPDLHWENVQQCQPTKSDTPALNREQEGNCFALHLYFAITSIASQWCGL